MDKLKKQLEKENAIINEIQMCQEKNCIIKVEEGYEFNASATTKCISS